EEAGQSECRVDSKAGGFAAGLGQFELKQVVGETRDDMGVVKESAHALTHRLGRDAGVSAGYRAQHPIVELEVEGEHRLIECRDWIGIAALIVLASRSGALAQSRGRKRNDRKQGRCEHHPARACPFDLFRTRSHLPLHGGIALRSPVKGYLSRLKESIPVSGSRDLPQWRPVYSSSR